MKKVLDIGKSQGYRRNLLVSSDDFHLIFNDGGRFSDRDNEDLDSKIKTALLIIEKDFFLKLGYSPIIARPRALFTHAYFRGSGREERRELQNVFGNFLVENGDYSKVNLKAFWEKNYPNYSFARLKYELYSNPTKFGFQSKDSFHPIIIVETTTMDDY